MIRLLIAVIMIGGIDMSGLGRFLGKWYEPEAAAAKSAAASVAGASVGVVHSVAADLTSFCRFMSALEDYAESRGYARGVISAQVAQETGYGKSVIGKNLFNIKATTGWQGKKAQVKTFEYDKQGNKYNTYAYFRDYDSFEESIADYIRLISTASRYTATWAARNKPAQYFLELYRAGYATDIKYTQNLQARFDVIKNLV